MCSKYQRYSNESAPEMIGPLAINELLRHGERLFENDMLGPEAFALDDQGKGISVDTFYHNYFIFFVWA